MTKTTFEIEIFSDGEYNCHGCGSIYDLVSIKLPELCNQTLVLCTKCRQKLMLTISYTLG